MVLEALEVPVVLVDPARIRSMPKVLVVQEVHLVPVFRVVPVVPLVQEGLAVRRRHRSLQVLVAQQVLVGPGVLEVRDRQRDIVGMAEAQSAGTASVVAFRVHPAFRVPLVYLDVRVFQAVREVQVGLERSIPRILLLQLAWQLEFCLAV